VVDLDVYDSVIIRAYNEMERLINRVVNRGKVFTVKEGMLRAAGSIRLFTLLTLIMIPKKSG
jgi:hypothetical protein